MAGELLFQTSVPSAWFASIPYFILTPVAFVGDVVILPKRIYDHVALPANEFKKANEYLKIARNFGYTEKDMSFIPFYYPVKHIDQ